MSRASDFVVLRQQHCDTLSRSKPRPCTASAENCDSWKTVALSGCFLGSGRVVLVPEDILLQTLGPQWVPPPENGGEFPICQSKALAQTNFRDGLLFFACPCVHFVFCLAQGSCFAPSMLGLRGWLISVLLQESGVPSRSRSFLSLVECGTPSGRGPYSLSRLLQKHVPCIAR